MNHTAHTRCVADSLDITTTTITITTTTTTTNTTIAARVVIARSVGEGEEVGQAAGRGRSGRGGQGVYQRHFLHRR